MNLENPETSARACMPMPIGNFAQINEYRQSIESFITMLKRERTSLVTTFDTAELVSRARNFLKQQLASVRFETLAFYKIVEVDREPKFVVDILVAIPEYDRDKKFAILSVIGNMMRRYPEILFDFRIIKKKKIPDEYTPI